MLEPRECGEKLISEANQHSVAMVFGRERTGLTNDELQLCHYHVCVPANPEYSSLNLAMAVQLLSYEVRMAYLALQQSSQSSTLQEEYPRHQELERFYAHLEQVIMQTEFISAQQPGQVMNKLRRMFTRARPEAQEINILRGILTSVQKSISRKE